MIRSAYDYSVKEFGEVDGKRHGSSTGSRRAVDAWEERSTAEQTSVNHTGFVSLAEMLMPRGQTKLGLCEKILASVSNVRFV